MKDDQYYLPSEKMYITSVGVAVCTHFLAEANRITARGAEDKDKRG